MIKFLKEHKSENDYTHLSMGKIRGKYLIDDPYKFMNEIYRAIRTDNPIHIICLVKSEWASLTTPALKSMTRPNMVNPNATAIR